MKIKKYIININYIVIYQTILKIYYNISNYIEKYIVIYQL